MIFSLSSFLAALFWGSIMIGILLVLIKSDKLLAGNGIYIFLLLAVFTIIRITIPVELPHTISIYSKYVATFCYDWLLYKPVFTAFDNFIFPWQILSVIWCIGSVFYLLYLLKNYLRLRNLLRTFPSQPLASYPEFLQLQAEGCYPHLNSKKFRVIKTKYADTPALIGFLHPVILLPEINFTHDELRCILLHELSHHRNLDFLWKLFMESLCACYWWNPLIWKFKNQFYTLLELRIDHQITKHSDTLQQFSYLECMIHMYKHQQKQGSFRPLTSTFNSQRVGDLCRRTHYILDLHQRRFQKIFTAFCMFILLLSTLFVVEPIFSDPYIEQTTFEIRPDNAYIKTYCDGSYGLFADHIYRGPVPAELLPLEPFSLLKIYERDTL